MGRSVQLYLRYAAASVRSQLQYRVSVIMTGVGYLLITGVEFFGVWALLDRFGHIRGFGLAEIALLYGMANMSLGLSEIFGHGFKSFAAMVRSGDFDRLLLRPVGTAFQVGAQHLQMARLGRVVQGAAVVAYALGSLPSVGASQVGLMLASVAGGACTFAGLFVLQATVAFWTVESLELFSIVTYGGVEVAQFPLSIYSDALRRMFTWVIPMAFVNYIPGLLIMGRPERFGPEWLAWVSPAVGVGFLLVCLALWRVGERHYRSTGS